MSAAPGGDDPATTSRRAPSRGRAALAALLVLALVAGVVVVGYLAYRTARPTADPFDPTAGTVLASDRERGRAVATAEQFALRMDSIDGADFDTYVAGIRELLTTKAQAEFEESGQPFDEAYGIAGLKGEGEVLASGVSEMGDDAATVLVAHNSEVSTEQGDVENFWRWSVDLVQVDGEWLVDGFTPVT